MRLGLALICALFGISRHSAAQPKPERASLVVTRGEGAQDCPEATQLAEQIRSVAGRDVIEAGLGPAAVETWVQVSIVRTFGGYSAQIATTGARHGTRSIEDLGPGCASLNDAIAVTIAIFLDPYANAPAPPPPPKPTALAKADSAKQPVSSDEPRSPRFFLNAATGIGFGLLQHAKPFLTGSLGVRASPRWSFAWGGSFVFHDSAATAQGAVDLSLAYGYASACGRALGEDEGLRLDWCAATLLGSLAGSGRGYQSNFSRRSAWLALALGPEAIFPIARSLSWVLTGQAVVPLERRGFDVQNGGLQSDAFQAQSVAGTVSLGIRGQL